MCEIEKERKGDEKERETVCVRERVLTLTPSNQERFMRTPHLFSALKLPIKLPPDALPVVLDKLPLPGYLQHTVNFPGLKSFCLFLKS